MNKRVFANRVVFCLFALLAVLLFLSCGFEPAWKSQDTTVSFRLGPAARAIASGGGYLYIRPLGGPLGAGPKPYIGPIELNAGDTFTTTEIAPGSYDGFVLIYSPEPIDARISNDLSVREVFSSNDETFLYNVTGTMSEEFLGTILENKGSLVNTGPLTVVEGMVTEIKATLIPVLTGSNNLPASDGVLINYPAAPGPGNRYREFLKFSGFDSLFTGVLHYGIFQIVGSPDAVITLNALTVYQANGKPWPVTIDIRSVYEVWFSDGRYNTSTLHSSPDTLYLYIDITVVGDASASLTFDPEEYYYP